MPFKIDTYATFPDVEDPGSLYPVDVTYHFEQRIVGELYDRHMNVTAKSHAKRRSFTWTGVFCFVLSVLAILLSIGMPGVGWMVAAGGLTVCSAITPWIGKRYIAGSLVVSILHLFSFGPLPLLGGAASVRPWPPAWFLACFVAFPLLLAVMALLFGGRQLSR